MIHLTIFVCLLQKAIVGHLNFIVSLSYDISKSLYILSLSWDVFVIMLQINNMLKM